MLYVFLFFLPPPRSSQSDENDDDTTTTTDGDCNRSNDALAMTPLLNYDNNQRKQQDQWQQ